VNKALIPLTVAAAGKTIEEHEVPSIISSNDPSNIEVRLKFAVAVEFAAFSVWVLSVDFIYFDLKLILII
jgi:hypothetical protein